MLTATLFGAPVCRTYGGAIADGRYEPVAFRLPLGLKDIRLALAAAQDAGVPMPAAALVRDRVLSVQSAGGDEQDVTAIARAAARDAGLPDKT